MDEYSTGGGGKLKLKGSKVSDGRVKKKKSKKGSNNSTDKEADVPQQKEGATVAKAEADDGSPSAAALDEEVTAIARDQGEASFSKTEAERRYEEMKRRRLQERLKREGVKTHKERVEELNKYLSRLSEHHDMPKIGPG